MKLAELLGTLKRLETRERNVVTESRSAKMAANYYAEALRKAQEIIDYSATAELLAPPVEYQIDQEVASTLSNAEMEIMKRKAHDDVIANLQNRHLCPAPKNVVLEPKASFTSTLSPEELDIRRRL